MMAAFLLYSGVLAGVMLLTVLFFVLTVAAEELEAGEGCAKRADPDTESLYERVPKTVDPLRAVIHCAACPPASARRFEAMGYTDCGILNRAFGGNLACAAGCLGLGSCARMCPNDAIALRDGAVFVTGYCAGCGRCVAACPKKLIELVPVSGLKTVQCAGHGIPDPDSKCPIALDATPHSIDYRKFRNTGFKLPAK